MCHDEPELLRRVATVLNYNEDKVFVHVDKKVDIKPFKTAVKDLPNVIMLDKRHEVFWGGFSSIVATMELICAALSLEIKFDRIILLQGKDYPLHSPKYIHRFFQLRQKEEFCKAKNISTSDVPGDYMKCCGYWCMDHISGSVCNRVFRKFLAILNTRIKIKYRQAYFHQDDTKWDVYKGWAQVALTAKCAEYVLGIYDNNEKYNNFMRHRFPPDEIYIHTILYNSPYVSKISDFLLQPRKNALWESEYLNLTYFEYPMSVTIFTIAIQINTAHT